MKYKSSHPYFPHIIDRFNEDSFVTLRREYGVEGYGFYWMILEIMAKREDCCLIVSENLYKNLPKYTDFVIRRKRIRHTPKYT